MQPTQVTKTKPLVGGRRIAVLATGGTIAGLIREGAGHGTYKAAQLTVQDLLASLPADFTARPANVVAEQVAQLDSKDMTTQIWGALAERCAYYLEDEATDGIVITHGTDTLEETAWFLQRVLAQNGKPVVLVSAMRPAYSLEADGPQNLADGLAVAQSDVISGVVVVHAGEVHAARLVQKVHPSRLNAFSSVNAVPLASVCNGVLVLNANGQTDEVPEYIEEKECKIDEFYWRWQADRNGVVGATWPRVALLTSHAGVDAGLVDLLIQAGYAGVVLQATGNGTVHEALLGALEQAECQGLVVWITSRCALGNISAHAETLPFKASPLPGVKARIDLALTLMQQV